MKNITLVFLLAATATLSDSALANCPAGSKMDGGSCLFQTQPAPWARDLTPAQKKEFEEEMVKLASDRAAAGIEEVDYDQQDEYSQEEGESDE